MPCTRFYMLMQLNLHVEAPANPFVLSAAEDASLAYMCFLHAYSHLYKRGCPFVSPPVGWPITSSVTSFSMHKMKDFLHKNHWVSQQVKLHLFRKVCLLVRCVLVRPLVRESSRKKTLGHISSLCNDAPFGKKICHASPILAPLLPIRS